jgi:hypothetical protein
MNDHFVTSAIRTSSGHSHPAWNIAVLRAADRKGNREVMVVICANSAPGVVIIVLSPVIFSTRSSRGMLRIRGTRSQNSFSNLLREIREAFDVSEEMIEQRIISLIDARDFSAFLIALESFRLAR